MDQAAQTKPSEEFQELERLRFRALLFEHGRKRLARIVAHEPLQETLDGMLAGVERLLPGVTTTLLMVNPDGKTLSLAAAPSLPDSFAESVDGFPIGENMACCGTACLSGESQYCADTKIDRRWQDFQDVATALGVRACWSQPVTGSDGEVIASFSIYRQQPGLPGMEEEEVLSSAAHLASIAICLDRNRRSIESSSALYREMFESNSAVKLVIDPSSGQIVRANPAAADFYGYGQVELESMNIDQINTLQGEEIKQALRDCQRRKRRRFQFLHRVSSGEIRQVEVFSGPIQLEGRQLLFSIVHDISERVTAETALKESQARYGFVTKGSLDGFWDWDYRTKEGWWSARFCELLGLGNADRVSDKSRLFDFMHPDDIAATKKAFSAHLDHDVSYDLEYRLKHKVTGEYRWFHARGQAFRNENGKAIRMSGSIRDIQDQKDAAEQQHRIEERLQRIQRLESLAVLSGGIAHDFNNFLTSILGSAAMVRERVRVQKNPEEQVLRIEAAAFNAADLCKKLLAYAGKGPHVNEAVEFSPLVADMVEVLRAVHPAVNWQVDLGARQGQVLADPSQLRQVVLNLLTNAAESMGQGRGGVQVTTGRREFTEEELADALPNELPQASEYLFLEVRDRGLGMDGLTKERLFEPFYSTKSSGRGLGMASVLGILRAHGGGILVESEAGIGSTFAILLPIMDSSIKDASDAGEAPAAISPHTLADAAYKASLLVVDDQIAVRELLEEMLTYLGFEALTVPSGEEAVKLLKGGQRFGGVILDLTMPGMDGPDTREALLQLQPDLPILLASGYGAEFLEGKLTASLKQGILRKPFTLAGLSEGLQAAGIRTASSS